mgnify:CR=1 FL=1
MKKVICDLSKDEVEKYTLLLSNYYTFTTLKTLDQIKNSDVEIEKIEKIIIELKDTIEDCKKQLLISHNVPYYVSTPMHISIEDCTIYINI